ncbi:MAG: pyridoxamine 5'-phosphate oxidase family protein [Saprospiraceae bacterium]|nr:pyridoxamine 5'-phosphate oxidase family protein [Saprospiraceae bacterium]
MLGELNGTQINEVLKQNVIGHLGCSDLGETYVVPVTYAYDGDSIICHSAPGKKIDMMRSNPRVCFQVNEMRDMGNWKSVIAWGRFEELAGDEAKRAIRFFVDRLAPLMPSETSHPTHGFNPEKFNPQEMKWIVFKIRLGKKTGRYEQR